MSRDPIDKSFRNGIRDDGRPRRVTPERKKRPMGTAAINFLRRLARKSPWVLTAMVPDGRTLTRTFTIAEEARKFVAVHNVDENIYYQANPTKTALSSKARKKDIARVEYLHADLDPNDDERSEDFKARMLPRIEAYEPKPTFVIDSGNGYQLLWRLVKAVENSGPEVIDAVEARNYALALAFDANPSTRNIDRLLRLPGTTNFPNRKKRKLGRTHCRAKLLKYNDVAYPLSDFPPYGPEKTSPPNKQTKSGTTNELPAKLRNLLLSDGNGGYRSRSELAFAFLTDAIRAGLPDSAIITACLDESYRGKVFTNT